MQLLTDYEALLPTISHPVYMARYTDNHDEGRGIYRFGLQAVKVMVQLLYFTNHCIPFMLTGQEFGAANRPSIHNRFGLCDKGRHVVDGDRIYWKEGVEFEGNSFLRTCAERRSLMQFYRQLIELRKTHPALQTGSFTPLDPQEEGPASSHAIAAFERRHARETVRCLFNLGHTEKRFSNSSLFRGKRLYGGIEKEGVLPPFSMAAFIAD